MQDNDLQSPPLNSTEDTTTDSIPVICKQHNLSLRIRTSSKSYLKKQPTVDSPTVVSPPMGNKIPILKRAFSTDESRNESNNNVKGIVNKNLAVNRNQNGRLTRDNTIPDENPQRNGLCVNHVNNIKQQSLDETLLKRVDAMDCDEEKTRKQYSLDDSIIRANHLVNQELMQSKTEKPPQIKVKGPAQKIANLPNVSATSFVLKNKNLLSTNKKSDSLQWLKRQFSLANKENNYFRNIKMQRWVKCL